MPNEDLQEFDAPMAEPEDALDTEADDVAAGDDDAPESAGESADDEDEYEVEERRADPLQRWLLVVVLLIVIVFMAAAASLTFYALSMRGAPRTSIERSINSDEVAVRENPQVNENWARLALSYASARRWSEALSAIARGRRIHKSALLDLAEADVLRMKGDRAAIAAYQRAIDSGQAEYKAQMKSLLEKKGVISAAPNALVFEAMAGRAQALDTFGRTEEAIEQAREALKLQPTDADLHTLLGDMLAKSGRKDEAKKEYRAALQYVPDLQDALDGLKRLGEVK